MKDTEEIIENSEIEQENVNEEIPQTEEITELDEKNIDENSTEEEIEVEAEEEKQDIRELIKSFKPLDYFDFVNLHWSFPFLYYVLHNNILR